MAVVELNLFSRRLSPIDNGEIIGAKVSTPLAHGFNNGLTRGTRKIILNGQIYCKIIGLVPLLALRLD